MALLPNIFNPAFYEGGTSGVLGNLPMYFTQPGASQGFPDTPTGAPRPPMAAPQAQPSSPMGAMPEAPAAQPSIFSRFMSGINDNSDLLMGIGAGLLQGKGLGGGLQMGSQFAAAAGKRNVTDDIKEFEYARAQGFKGTLQDWMQRKRAGAGEYGLQAIWGTDKDGRPALIQLGKSGEAIQSRLPEGFSPAKDPIKVDMGTHWGFLDPQTRQLVTTQPKNIAETKVQEAVGSAQGTAQVNLPKVVDTANRSLALVDEMIHHPGRATATGLSGQIDPRNYLAGTDATDFRIRQEQIQGQTFLQAFESLKGGGAITELEGQKAQAAIARLNTKQSDEEYVKALNELKGVLQAGISRAQRMAAGNFTPASPAAAPAAAGSTPDPLGIR